LQDHCHACIPAGADCIERRELLKETGLQITDQVIRKTIGVTQRRMVQKGTSDTDLLLKAASGCLEKAGISASELSKLIVNKFLGDKLLPMTASLLQAKMDCPVAIQAFDIDGGVNSFLQAFDMAARMIDSGDNYILIVSGGVISPFIRKNDARHAFLFGDGAAAILLGPSEEQHLYSTYQFSNSDYADLVTGFELRQIAQADRLDTDDYSGFYDIYKMEDWSRALPFIKEAAEHTTTVLLKDAGLARENIDLLLVTEYNQSVRDSIIKASGIPAERSLSVLHKYGNTLSAMLPLLLCEASDGNRMSEGINALMISIGEGISGGGLIYHF
jgi:3-oxoacyl-[acyl-carrier-protein] synthase III